MSTVGVIPARYGSTRFPGKALAMLHGKPIVVHCAESTSKARMLDRVIVATDHEAIAAVVRDAGFEVEMTSADCATGGDRVAEVVRRLGAEWEIVVNVQGDEPYISPKVIDDIVVALRDAPDCGVSTAMVKLATREDFVSPHNVKAVASPTGRALYFSRSPIPSLARVSDEEMQRNGFCWGMKHLGLYAYRRDVLLDFTQWPQTPLEKREKLEQLRLMEHGVGIRIVEVDHDSVGVDTPEELEALRNTAAPVG